jgi:hypothetical protein
LYDLDGELILLYNSSWDAANNLFPELDKTDKVIGKKAYSLQRCCNGIRKTAFGFVWKWMD